jgi:hypothetical protein
MVEGQAAVQLRGLRNLQSEGPFLAEGLENLSPLPLVLGV